MSAFGLTVDDILSELRYWRSWAADEARGNPEQPRYQKGAQDKLEAVAVWLYENGYGPSAQPGRLPAPTCASCEGEWD